MTQRRRLLVFEGSDGAGKSTQIALLAEKLAAQGRACVQLREPGGTDLGEDIRKVLKYSKSNPSPHTELLLMNASRAQLVDTVILPALEQGKDVLLDRFFYSTIAYQGFGRRAAPANGSECHPSRSGIAAAGACVSSEDSAKGQHRTAAGAPRVPGVRRHGPL